MDLTISARPRQSGFRSTTVSWRRQAPRSCLGLGAGFGGYPRLGRWGLGRWGLADGSWAKRGWPDGDFAARDRLIRERGEELLAVGRRRLGAQAAMSVFVGLSLRSARVEVQVGLVPGEEGIRGSDVAIGRGQPRVKSKESKQEPSGLLGGDPTVAASLSLPGRELDLGLSGVAVGERVLWVERDGSLSSGRRGGDGFDR